MFTPKLIVTDLDGTALRSDKTISPATRNAFSQCQKAGIHIAVATARYIAGAAPFARALHADYQILTDGTLVYRDDMLIYANTLDISQTNQLLNELSRRQYLQHIAIPTVHGLFRYPEGIPYHPDSPDPAACQCTSDNNTRGYHFNPEKTFPYPAAKMVVELPSEADAREIALLCNCNQFRYHGENRYTFYHSTASKLDAISQIAGDLDISLKDILVFGDDVNDLEMITSCGYGVAMGNAIDSVKAAANEITLTNDEDGIVPVLQRFL